MTHLKIDHRLLCKRHETQNQPERKLGSFVMLKRRLSMITT